VQQRPIHYLQYDPAWGGIMFSNHGDPNQTIASSGCGATTMAMVAATFIDSGIDPPTIAQFVLDNGYRTYNDGVDWGFFAFAAEYYHLPFKNTGSTDEVIEALQNGALVVASMGPGYFTSYGHYILLWGLDGVGNILVNDPNSVVRTQASYGLFREQAANYFIFYPKPTVQEVLNMFADMMGHWAAGDVEFLEQKGIIQGDGSGGFNPDAPITRAEAAALIARTLRLLGIQ